jgi:hypothetical protein
MKKKTIAADDKWWAPVYDNILGPRPLTVTNKAHNKLTKAGLGPKSVGAETLRIIQEVVANYENTKSRSRQNTKLVSMAKVIFGNAPAELTGGVNLPPNMTSANVPSNMSSSSSSLHSFDKADGSISAEIIEKVSSIKDAKTINDELAAKLATCLDSKSSLMAKLAEERAASTALGAKLTERVASRRMLELEIARAENVIEGLADDRDKIVDKKLKEIQRLATDKYKAWVRQEAWCGIAPTLNSMRAALAEKTFTIAGLERNVAELKSNLAERTRMLNDVCSAPKPAHRPILPATEACKPADCSDETSNGVTNNVNYSDVCDALQVTTDAPAHRPILPAVLSGNDTLRQPSPIPISFVTERKYKNNNMYLVRAKALKKRLCAALRDIKQDYSVIEQDIADLWVAMLLYYITSGRLDAANVNTAEDVCSILDNEFESFVHDIGGDAYTAAARKLIRAEDILTEIDKGRQLMHFGPNVSD